MRPDETAGALNFHIGFLNKIPVLWTVFVVILLIGTVYYLAAGRRKAIDPVVTPAPDDPLPAAGAGAPSPG
jgi:hypothetical protein